MAFRPRSCDNKARLVKLPRCRTTTLLRDDFDGFWKTAEFLSNDGKNVRRFVSASDFQEFVMRLLIKKGGWSKVADRKMFFGGDF